MHALVEWLFRVLVVSLLVVLLVRQEKLMADVDTLNTEVAEVAADEATLETTIGTVLADLKKAQAAAAAGQPVDLSGAIASLAILHTKLTADQSTLVAGDTPVA